MYRKHAVVKAIVAMMVVAGLVITGVLLALGSLGDVTRTLLFGSPKLGDPVNAPLVLQTIDRSELVIVLEGRVLRQPNTVPLPQGE